MEIKAALKRACRIVRLAEDTRDYGRINMAKRFIHKYYPQRHSNLTLIVRK